MDAPDALYAELLRAPDDDTLRGALADAYEERDDKEKADAQRAAFVRAQLGLARLGPPRNLLTGGVRSGGPGYYRLLCARGDARVGDRVDVRDTGHHSQQGARPLLHGLKVTRVDVDDPALDTVWLTLRADGDSGPYPHGEARRLDKIADAAFVDHNTAWFRPAGFPVAFGPGWAPVGHPRAGSGLLSRWSLTNAHATVHVVRGFPSRISCGWEYWRQVAAPLTNWWPLADVELRDLPEIQHQPSPQSKKHYTREFAFAGRAPASQAYLSHSVWASERAWQANVDQESALRAVTLQLLEKTWPSVARWTLPDD